MKSIKLANMWDVVRMLVLVAVIALLNVYLLATAVKLDDAHAQATNARWVTLLAGSQRTATTTSTDQQNLNENLNARGAYITLDVTGVLTAPVITLTVQAKDPASEKYESIYTATTGVSAAGTHTYLIYPGAGTAGGDVVETLSYPLPPQWRVSVAHENTDPITYTVGALLLP